MKKNHFYGAICSILLAGLSSGTAQAESSLADSLAGMVSDGKLNFDFRYRYEMVDQAGFDDTSKAWLTLQLKL